MPDELSERQAAELRDMAAVTIVWDPEVLSPEDYAALVAAVGDVVRASGGEGIERLIDVHRN